MATAREPSSTPGPVTTTTRLMLPGNRKHPHYAHTLNGHVCLFCMSCAVAIQLPTCCMIFLMTTRKRTCQSELWCLPPCSLGALGQPTARSICEHLSLAQCLGWQRMWRITERWSAVTFVMKSADRCCAMGCIVCTPVWAFRSERLTAHTASSLASQTTPTQQEMCMVELSFSSSSRLGEQAHACHTYAMPPFHTRTSAQ
jgi:hypothetical protein